MLTNSDVLNLGGKLGGITGVDELLASATTLLRSGPGKDECALVDTGGGGGHVTPAAGSKSEACTAAVKFSNHVLELIHSEEFTTMETGLSS